MKKQRKWWKCALAALLCFCLLPTAALANVVVVNPDTGEGSGTVVKPDTGEGGGIAGVDPSEPPGFGDTVGFAGHEWIIIGTDAEDEGVTAPEGCYTLFAKNNDFGETAFRAGEAGDLHNSTAYNYKDSDLYKAMAAVARGFSAREKNNIVARATLDDIQGEAVTNQLVWPIGGTEADKINETFEELEAASQEESAENPRQFAVTYWGRSGHYAAGGGDEFLPPSPDTLNLLESSDESNDGSNLPTYTVYAYEPDGSERWEGGTGTTGVLSNNDYVSIANNVFAVRPVMYVKQDAVIWIEQMPSTPGLPAIGEKVYFGSQTWYVVGQNGSANTLTLFADDIFKESNGDPLYVEGARAYKDSPLYKAMGAKAEEIFADQEKAVIKLVTLSDGSANLALWPLSKSQFEAIPEENQSLLKADAWYWLYDREAAYIGKADGTLEQMPADEDPSKTYCAVRPAVQLDLTNLFYAASAPGISYDSPRKLNRPGANDAWTPTFFDDSLKLEVSLSKFSSGMYIGYKGTSGDRHYLSYVLVPEFSDGPVYYGTVANLGESGEGSAEVKLTGNSSPLMDGKYTLRFFTEDKAHGLFFASQTVDMTIQIQDGDYSILDLGEDIETSENLAPCFTEQPQNQQPDADGSVTFSVSAKSLNHEVVSCTWEVQAKAGGEWLPVNKKETGSAFTGTTLKISNAAATWEENGYTVDGGGELQPWNVRYRCVAKAGDLTTYSDSAEMTNFLIFTQQPQSQQPDTNGSVTFSAEAQSSGSAAITYTWEVQEKDGGEWLPVNEEETGSAFTGTTLEISNTSATWEENGYTVAGEDELQPWNARYRCVAKAGTMTTYSDPVEVTNFLTFTQQPQNQQPDTNGSVTFSAEAQSLNDQNITYTWEVQAKNAKDGGEWMSVYQRSVPGVVAPEYRRNTLTISNVADTWRDNGYLINNEDAFLPKDARYRCVAKVGALKIYSDPVEVTISENEHTLTESEAVSATCTTPGHIKYWTCNSCGKVFGDAAGTQEISLDSTVIPAQGHTWSSDYLKEHADADKHYHVCTVCGTKDTGEAHSYDNDQDKTCSVCGYERDVATEYTVTLHTNGGEVNSGNVTSYTYGTEVALPTDVTRSGHTFAGWYDNEALTGQAVKAIPATAAGNKEYWAKWTANAVAPPPSNPSTPSTPSTPVIPDPPAESEETVTNSDGSTTTTITKDDGSTSTTIVDSTGKVEADVTLSEEALADSGDAPAALPVPELSVTNDRRAVVIVTVHLPEPVVAKVEIPVQNATAGTVAVLVHDDGSEEVLKNTVQTETGISVAVSDGATLKIVDNSKTFDDVSTDYWGAEAIAFATSRELFAGTAENTFSPDSDMTRAMVWSVLARYEGADTTAPADSAWYAGSQQWAIAGGISDGTNPDAAMTREQFAAMLYRSVGSPAVGGSVGGFGDTASVSDWAGDAMIWAVQNGIIAGYDDGTLRPQNTATRTEVAAMLQRYVALNAR